MSDNTLTRDINFLENVEPFSARIHIREQADLSARYPEIHRVLGVKAQAAVLGTERVGDGVIVEGTVRYTVLYESLGEDDMPAMQSAGFEQEFSESIEAAGFTGDTHAFVGARVEEVAATGLDPRSLRLESTLSLSGKGVKTGHAQGLDPALLPPEVERKVLSLEWLQLSQVLDQQVALRESVELPARLPAPARLLYSEMQVADVSLNTAKEAPHIEGSLAVKVVYLSDDATLPPMEWKGSVPFSQPLYGETASALDSGMMDAQVRQVFVKVREGFEEEETRVLDVEAVVDVKGVLVTPGVKQIVTDLYGISQNYTVQTQVLNGLTSLQMTRLSVPVFNEEWEDIASGGAWRDAAFRIAAVDALPQEGSVRLDGVAVLELIQDTAEGWQTAIHEWPFVLDIEAENVTPQTGCAADIAIDADDGGCTAQVALWLCQIEEAPCIWDIQAAEETPEMVPGLYIRNVSPKETLWDIGKAYRMSAAQLAEFNQIAPMENPPPGSKLLIYKPRARKSS